VHLNPNVSEPVHWLLGDAPCAVLGVPCLTLRENTGRPVTVTQGTNTVVGSDPKRIVTKPLATLDGRGKACSGPEP